MGTSKRVKGESYRSAYGRAGGGPAGELATPRRGGYHVRMNDLTRVLSAIEGGDPQAAEQLLPLLYDDLRQLAAQRMARESPGQTLTATALVHEAYLRLVGGDTAQPWNSRGHFFGAAAEAMRRILVERARHKNTLKAGGDLRRQELSDIQPAVGGPDLDLLALNEALTNLEGRNKRQADLVKLRFFAGLTIEEAAEALGVSTSTAENDWFYARSWLRVEMGGADGSP
jgi:RNA polymerase sigma factor (TIGR02999 family)